MTGWEFKEFNLLTKIFLKLNASLMKLFFKTLQWGMGKKSSVSDWWCKVNNEKAFSIYILLPNLNNAIVSKYTVEFLYSETLSFLGWVKVI